MKKLAEGGQKDGATKRKFYAYVKQRTKTRTSIGPLKDREGKVVKEDKDMAGIFNTFFSSVFTREDVGNIPEPEPQHQGRFLREVSVTVKKVKDKIQKLRKGAAAGPDGLGPQILQELKDIIASPLATIMRRSLEEGTVPKDWKTANVTPIYKKGNKSSPGNYRPVSLTSVCGRILESIIKDEVVDHLERNKLIKKSQHGFMRGKSCTSNLLAFLDKVTAAVDNGEAVDVVYLDFAKAFDKVPVERLLKKVEAHGISGQILRWIGAWLRNREQRVVLNGEASDWAAVLSGVPQGSVLGPLLFLIFINDLDEAAAARFIFKFADDTKVAQPAQTEEDCAVLQESLDGLVQWAERWGMAFNVQKCKVMHLGHANRKHVYTMNGAVLEETEEERDLGVMISNKLKPGTQCAKAARTAAAVLGQISRAFHFKDRYVFVQLYKQYVWPHLEFAVQAWSPWAVADKEVLEAVQRRMVRMVSGLRSTEYEDRLKELGMTTLEERRHQADMAMMFKTMRGVDGQKEEWFTPAAAGQRRTRVADDPLNVRLAHGRLELRKNFFTVRCTEHWNNVPGEIKNLRSVESFKKAYATHRQLS